MPAIGCRKIGCSVVPLSGPMTWASADYLGLELFPRLAGWPAVCGHHEDFVCGDPC
jgi:hypothetical protein